MWIVFSSHLLNCLRQKFQYSKIDVIDYSTFSSSHCRSIDTDFVDGIRKSAYVSISGFFDTRKLMPFPFNALIASSSVVSSPAKKTFTLLAHSSPNSSRKINSAASPVEKPLHWMILPKLRMKFVLCVTFIPDDWRLSFDGAMCLISQHSVRLDDFGGRLLVLVLQMIGHLAVVKCQRLLLIFDPCPIVG